jgi:type IV pilus assembly protein PilB
MFNINANNLIDQENLSITSQVEEILKSAIALEASDIHIEPYAEFSRLRFRIDGMLNEITKIKTAFGQRLITRLKILARLDIAEKRLPQDGRFTLNVDNKQIYDLRLSTCPTMFGEKAAVRILNPQNAALAIDSLGLDIAQKNQFQKYIHRPQGMILVTGPTGSGKTNTLYTILKILNKTTKNISSAEDPVEIVLHGINQVEINPKIGLTFATVLRTFLRQDPDILMVGEIRDLETAQIAIKAAQTGHLVLSTLHTNNATESITRLLNMGISAFNLASTISLVVAQRLLRILCEHCKKTNAIPVTTLVDEGLKPCVEVKNVITFSAIGCTKCSKGYKGRVGIFEFLPISKLINNLILQQATAREIEAAAHLEGMQTMRESALKKVAQSITSLEEVNRVLG